MKNTRSWLPMLSALLQIGPAAKSGAAAGEAVVTHAHLRGRLRQRRIFQLPVSLLLCSLCLGCLVVPLRVPTQTSHGKIDLTFIHPGSTKREEVLEKLRWADTGLNNERLFLGRWSRSKWAVAWFVGGYGAGTGDAKRIWGAENLMIEFDETGVVQQSRRVSDEALAKELSAWLVRSHSPDLDLSTPMEISIADHHVRGDTYQPARLVLAQDYLELKEPEKKSREFRVPRGKLTQITFAGVFKRDEPELGYLNHTLHFAEKTSVGRQMTVQTDLPGLLMLVKYLGQSHKD